MIIDGLKIIDTSILQAQGVRDGDTPMDVQVAVACLMQSDKYLTFLWKQLRGKRIRGEYKKIKFETGHSAGRTVVRLIWDISETQCYVASYVGISDGYSAGLSNCAIEHSTVDQFVTELQEFAENFDLIEIHENT